MEWLDDLREQKFDLPSGTSTSGATIDEKGSASTYWSARQNYTPIFDIDDELNWKIDNDLVEAVGTSRE